MKTKKEEKKTEDKSKIVLPGDLLEDSIDYLAGHGTYREGSKIYSKLLGIVRKNAHAISVIPLAGAYMPKRGDMVIGEIKYVALSSWKVNIGAPYQTILQMGAVPEYVERGADLSKYYKRGDLIFAQVEGVTQDMLLHVTLKDRRARKLYGGKIVEITPAKVPRLIGREGTMIKLIHSKTDCNINIGQNGLVWIKGRHEDAATRAVKMVDKLAHESGLTDRIGKFLDKEIAKAEKAEAGAR